MMANHTDIHTVRPSRPPRRLARRELTGLPACAAAVWAGGDELRQAAEGGEPAANLALGDAYAAGIGVPRQSDKEAYRCYKVAAAAGEPDGQYRLGLCYERGKGCMGDAQRATRLYDAAARAGHLAAAARAGAMQTGGEEY